MIWLYRILFLPAMALLSPYYVRRMLRRGGYGEDFMQRFGRTPVLPTKGSGVRRIWLQAVSVGEMLAIGPLVEALRQLPGTELYLSTTTSTGYKLAKERYGKHLAGIGYFPIDFWLFSRRAWRAIAPDLVLLTEGERWPEHIHQASQRGVPVVCVNARMSDKGFRRMMSVRPLVRSLFGGVTRWLTCSHQDTERLLALGFPAERITETGNIKLDVSIPLLDPVIREQLRRELGLDQPLVLLGSSTWPGEEAAMIEAWRAARDAGLPVSLLLVPRHAERRAELASLLSAQELSHHFRSKGAAAGPVAVSVADTTGELRKLTQLADLVFVGKSLPPHHEGQTPVEAAALAKPVIFGPDLSNFRQIAKDLRSLGAVRSVRDAAELKAVVVELLRDSASRERMAAAAQAWFKASQGALARTVAALREVMPS